MWQYVCCICFVGDFGNKMDIDSATDAVKEEHLTVEATDNPYGFKITNIVSLARDTDGSCTAECVSGDLCPEVKQENSSVVIVKEEPDDVCFVIGLLLEFKVHSSS